MPMLTFLNAVLCLKSNIHLGQEVSPKAVGRLALGAHSKTTNEAVQSDVWFGLHLKPGKHKGFGRF